MRSTRALSRSLLVSSSNGQYSLALGCSRAMFVVFSSLQVQDTQGQVPQRAGRGCRCTSGQSSCRTGEPCSHAGRSSNTLASAHHSVFRGCSQAVTQRRKLWHNFSDRITLNRVAIRDADHARLIEVCPLAACCSLPVCCSDSL